MNNTLKAIVGWNVVCFFTSKGENVDDMAQPAAHCVLTQYGGLSSFACSFFQVIFFSARRLVVLGNYPSIVPMVVCRERLAFLL
jgi:hypothetical protein